MSTLSKSDKNQDKIICAKYMSDILKYMKTNK